jgi:hypothetical protein
MSDVDIDIENKQNDDIQSEQEIASDSYSSDNNDINMEQRFDIPSETELNKLDQKKLKKLCRDNGLKVGGNKTKLKERLLDPGNAKNKSNRKWAHS